MKFSLVFFRKMAGTSMAPMLRPGQWIVAIPLLRRHLKPGQVVVLRSRDRETIKRIERIQDGKLFVIGDNLADSTDSRQFGWLDRSMVAARVVRPKLAK